jgi:hypothetical protein
MCTNTQLHWIAEAEARCLRESALSQRDWGEPAIVVQPEPCPLWRSWLRRTMSRLAIAPKTAACEQAWHCSVYDASQQSPAISPRVLTATVSSTQFRRGRR